MRLRYISPEGKQNLKVGIEAPAFLFILFMERRKATYPQNSSVNLTMLWNQLISCHSCLMTGRQGFLHVPKKWRFLCLSRFSNANRGSCTYFYVHCSSPTSQKFAVSEQSNYSIPCCVQVQPKYRNAIRWTISLRFSSKSYRCWIGANYVIMVLWYLLYLI